jgi:hypothetical protein
LDFPISDGEKITFRAPCDCTAVTGLIVRYPDATEIDVTPTSKAFTFKDAHGNNLTGIGNLFSAGAFISVILDVTKGAAYIQNAATNGYIESAFAPNGLVTYDVTIASEAGLDKAVSDAYATLGTRKVGFATFNVTESGLSLSGGIWHVTLYRTTNLYGYLVCGKYGEKAVYRRDLNGTAWGAWRNIGESAFAEADHTHTAAAVGAAPAGYGLGGEATTTDWNDATETGFYKGFTNSPNGQWFEGVVIKYSDVYCIQSVWRVGEVLHYERPLVNGTWGEWVEVIHAGNIGKQTVASATKIGGRIVNVGTLTVPTYSTSGSNGNNYYADVTVTGGTFNAKHTAGRPWVFLQVGTATTGVIAVEPLEWTDSSVTKIRIHRSTSATNVTGFNVYYFAIGT